MAKTSTNPTVQPLATQLRAQETEVNILPQLLCNKEAHAAMFVNQEDHDTRNIHITPTSRHLEWHSRYNFKTNSQSCI